MTLTVYLFMEKIRYEISHLTPIPNSKMNDFKEIWLDVVGFEGLYLISNLGRVKSIRMDKILTPKLCGARENNLYETVVFCLNSKRIRLKVHRLEAIAFIPNPNRCKCVNHKDNNKLNNILSNLEWVYGRENVTHSVKSKASKYTGVYWHSRDQTWFSSIAHNGRQIHCGEHRTEVDAANAYKSKLLQLGITNKYATLI